MCWPPQPRLRIVPALQEPGCLAMEMSGLKPPSCVITGCVPMGKLTAVCFILLPCKTKQTNKKYNCPRFWVNSERIARSPQHRIWQRGNHCASGLLDEQIYPSIQRHTRCEDEPDGHAFAPKEFTYFVG